MNNLYESIIHCMTPDRGYLQSEQNFVFVTDVDFKVKYKFDIVTYKDLDKYYYFYKSGCGSINPYQKKFIIKSSCDSIKTINNLKIFCYKKGEVKEIKLKKTIRKNTIEYHFTEKQVSGSSLLIFSKDYNSIDLKYDLRINVVNNIASKIYLKKGLRELVSKIDSVFEKEKLSGNLYRTRNGFRIILSDEFRNLEIEKSRFDSINLMKKFLSDPVYVEMYVNIKDWKSYRENKWANRGYGLRLSPKLKHYKFFDKSYEKILKKLENFQNEYVIENYLNNDNFPVEYDFKKITFNKNDLFDKKIESTFDLFKKLIKSYLKSEKYSVCRFIKSYGNKKSKTIEEFIKYHDMWTKSNNKNSILI